MTMREYLGSVAPLSIETTVYLHTVRKGQGVDTYTSHLYVSNPYSDYVQWIVTNIWFNLKSSLDWQYYCLWHKDSSR